MELLNQSEIQSILDTNGPNPAKIIKWSLKSFSNELVGYLGEHLTLNITLDIQGVESDVKLFVKCLPINDKWKAKYINELNFFHKEYVMLSKLFKYFQDGEGNRKWRPKLLYIRKDLFVFEDVTQIGYKMPCNRSTMTYNELCAVVETMARFHAQSIVYEEKMSIELNRTYTIWEDYSDVLCEPIKGHSWRDTGKKAVIDFLKVFSQRKTEINFMKHVDILIQKLFEYATNMMKPSKEFRNVIVHRDLWTNNIFLKQIDNGKFHALIIDFQTVLYCPPMLDLSSLIYFNTTRTFREESTDKLIDLYYSILAEELNSQGIDITNIIDKNTLLKSYQQSVIFGIIQAALIVPIVAMSDEMRKETFDNPEICEKVNVISRSEEFISYARKDKTYCSRVTEIFDEIIDRLNEIDLN